MTSVTMGLKVDAPVALQPLPATKRTSPIEPSATASTSEASGDWRPKNAPVVVAPPPLPSSDGKGTERKAALQKIIAQASGLEGYARLALINDFFNQTVRFGEDQDRKGVPDDWSTPNETMNEGAGDCEDYAVGKYFSLRAAGVPDSELRLAYVRMNERQTHMVMLWVPPDGKSPMVLDNMNNQLAPLSARADLTPVFSFNTTELWQGATATKTPGSARVITRWAGIIDRVTAEHFLPV